jgi:hypothetical protein
MKKLFVIIFIISLALKVHSDAYDFRMKIGYITFNMKHLKELQNEILEDINSIGIQSKKFGNYSNTLSYQIQFLRKKTGFFYEFASTGSRIDYRDYSGNYTFDQILNKHAIGFHGEHNPIPQFTDNLIQYIQIAYTFTTLDYKERVKVFGENLADSSTLFYSKGGSLELGVSYKLLEEPILVMFDVGGSVAYSQAFYLKGNSDAQLSTEENLVNPTWSGFKVGFTFSYDFKKF